MSLQHEMERVGQIIAADRNLTLTLRGVEAYSTPGKINLPNVETFSWLGSQSRRMLHALLDHETGHAVFSDHEIAAAAAGDSKAIRHMAATYERWSDPEKLAALKRCASPAFKMLANAVEDGWIEQRQMERYSGTRYNLTKKNLWFLSKMDKLASRDRWAQYMLAFTMLARGTGVERGDLQTSSEVSKMLDDSRDLLAEVDRVRDSGHALDVSLRIFLRFEETEEEPEPEPEDPESDDESEESDESEGEGESDDESEEGEGEESGESEEGEGSGGPSEGDESEDEESPGGEGGAGEEGGQEADGAESEPAEGAGAGEEDPERSPMKGHAEMDLKRWSTAGGGSMNPEDEISKEIRSVFEMPESVQPYVLFSREFDFERDMSNVLHPKSERWKTLLDESALATEALTSAFEVALKAKRERRPMAGADEGSIDVEALVEFAVGARLPDTMYTQWVAEDDTTIAVSILVDCSGSMGSFDGSHYSKGQSKARLAAITATAMHRALSTVGIDHEIGGFTCLESGDRSHPWVTAHESQQPRVDQSFQEMRAALREAEKRGTDVHRFARALYRRGPRGGGVGGALLVPAHAVFKPFGSPDGRGLCWVDGVHENLDGEAVLWQARRLAKRPEQRRVMFVLSDGAPAGARDNAQGRRYLKESVQRITEGGIEIYGIGLASAAVLEYYPRAWVANTTEELIDVALGSMTQVILEGRQENRWVDVA